MNPETTVRRVDRSELARLATEALERVACVAGRQLDRHAGGYGLSDAKLEVLDVLCCRQDRRACLHALGDELGVTRPNVTKLVDGLERTGLVERLPHPSDRRMVQAHVTDQGMAVAADALPGRNELMEQLWDALDERELELLLALLDAVVERTAERRATAGSASASG
jgi:DNA-binding MarR family transcriptional regulator